MSDYLDSLYSGLNDESVEAITAALGFNDGANKGFWRKQPRKKWGKGKGQWIEMGALLRALFKIDGKLQSVTGRSAGSDGTPNGVRFLPDAGQPGVDSNKIYGVDTAHLEEIQATLPDNYVESKGLDAKREQTGTGSVVSTANIPDINDMETADVTPDDIRMVEEGVNSVEGQEAEGFKNTDEGKQVATLDDVDESDVLTGEEVRDLVDGTTERDLSGYKGLKETSPGSGIWDYKEGKYNYRLRQNKAGKWEIYADGANPDYDYDTPADRRDMRGTFEKLDSGDGYDSVEDAMDNFFGAEYNPKKTFRTVPDAEGTTPIEVGLPEDEADLTLGTLPITEANLSRVSNEELASLGYGDMPGYSEYKGVGDDNAYFGMENKGGGNWEFTNYLTGEIFPIKADNLADAERQLADYRLKRGAYDPEVLAAQADAETAGSRGFTETMRGSLQGMKGRNIKGGFAKAYPNGRTATIVQDDDGSWHLEKHDEFNGGIQETKRFEDNFFSSGLDQALAEGDAYLNEDIALPMTRKEFGDYVENRYNDAERTKPAFLDEAAIDEAFETYSDMYKESKADNGWVSKDMDADARSQAFSELDDTAVADENPFGDIDGLIKDAMDGKDVSLDGLLNEKSSMEDEDKGGTPDDEEENSDFDADLEDTDLEITSDDQDPELLRDIVSKERDEAENVNIGDVIMGPDGMPVRVKRYDWDESDSDEESPGLTITATDANGEEVEFYKGRYDSVYYPEFAPEGAAPKAKPADKPITPADATPVTPTRVAPDNALEVDAGRVQIGDKLYSPDGSTLLGEVTQTRKKGGKTEARLSLDGKDEGFQELGPVNLVDRNPNVNAQKQAEKDAKKAETARVKAEKKAADEKAAADKAAAVNDPRTDEGIENLRNILEAANNPERLQSALDVLNDPSLSNNEKAEKLVEALTTKLGRLSGTDDQRMDARKAEQKAMKMLEEAGIRGSSKEERKLRNEKASAAFTIRNRKGMSFRVDPTLESEVAEMNKRLDAGEDVSLEELEALESKISDYQKRFFMKGDSNEKPLPGEAERVDEEIRKAQRAGTAPIPFVRQDGTEIRPDDNVATPAAPTTPGATSAPTTPATPTQYKTPAPTPKAPKHPKPVRKSPKAKPIGTPDDDGKPIKGDNKTDAEIAAMRNRKLENAIDADGNPVFAKDLNGNILTDKKGRPIPLQDTDAILAALRADYPDAKLDNMGNVVVHREKYKGEDGSEKMFEVLVHMNTGGKIGLSMRFTDPETGEVEHLIHHDERDSYMGLHGKTNGIQALIDIVQGKKPGTDRRTATRGYDTTGRTDLRERAEYFVRQGRLLTQGQVWDKYLSGIAEEINTSAGGRGANKGTAYLTKRTSAVASAAEALRQGKREVFFQRVRAAVGHTPVHPTQRAEMRKAIRDYLEREMPEMSPRERTVLAQYVDRHLTRRGELVDPTGRDIPFVSSETRKLEPGLWVDYENNFGEISRGRVVSLDDPELNEAGTEYYDNITVEFANGERVSKLTSQKMTPVSQKEQSKAVATKYIGKVTGEERRRRRREQLGITAARTTGVLRFLDDVRAEDAEIAENANKTGGKVEDLFAGDTLFSKDGDPLGPIIEKIPIVGKSGNPGFAVIFENADGEEVQVRLPFGEFRGPKA
jgi:hypothetical protein